MRWTALWLILSILCVSSPTFPHGGGLDGHGCGHNRVHGGYHCHRGPFKGAMFDSQAEMLQALEESALALFSRLCRIPAVFPSHFIPAIARGQSAAVMRP